MKTTNALQILSEFLKTPESRFMSIVYTNKKKETSRYLLHLNVNYKKVVARDLAVLSRTYVKTGLEEQAKAELVSSLQSTLEGNNTGYTKAGYYETLVPGRPVKYHESELYVNAFVVNRVVLVAGEYKEVNSAPLTIAKNKLRKLLKVSKFREFRLDLNQIHAVKMNGKIIEVQ